MSMDALGPDGCKGLVLLLPRQSLQLSRAEAGQKHMAVAKHPPMAVLFPQAPSQLSIFNLTAQMDTKQHLQAAVEGVIPRISV